MYGSVGLSINIQLFTKAVQLVTKIVLYIIINNY